MTSTEQTNPTANAIWRGHVADARIHRFIEPPADEQTAIRELAVIRTLIDLSERAIPAAIAYSGTPGASTKTYAYATGTVTAISHLVGFDADGQPQRPRMVATVQTKIVSWAIPLDLIFDFQNPGADER